MNRYFKTGLVVLILLVHTMLFSQITLTTLDVDNNGEVRGNLFSLGKNAGTSTATLRVGFARSNNGTAAFDLIGDVNNYPGFGFRFQRFGNGQTNMIHTTIGMGICSF